MEKMKIGILTHPLKTNYGGILQCYALCTVLRRMGHQPVIIDRRHDRGPLLWRICRKILKALKVPRYNPPVNEKGKRIKPFIDKEFEILPPVDSNRKMRKCCGQNKLDAVIVGSDQVWRRDFALKFGWNYFLDFVPDNVIKLSYAASFGLDQWVYTSSDALKIKNLLSSFSGVSVREKDAVILLRNNIGIEADCDIDPTLLLKNEDYDRIAAERPISKPYVFIYWLGKKSDIVDEIERYRIKGYEIITVFLRDDKIELGIGEWIAAIKYADCVITDSFHGCVFSILYNRKFKIYKNSSGGVSRLSTLFEMFGIKESTNLISVENVDSILKPYRQKAADYVLKSLVK